MSDAPFKVFETEKDLNTFKDKTFKNGYNESQKGAVKSLNERLGIEASSFDDIVSHVKGLEEKVSNGITDATQTEEYKALQEKFKSEKKAKEEALLESTNVSNKYKFDSTWSETVSGVTDGAEFVITEDKVKRLFSSDYDITWENGTPIVKQNGVTVTDDNSNPKPLGDVIQDYTKEYLKTTAQGTGGGSGSGGSAKPNYKDFSELISSGKELEADKLLDSAIEAGGWAEADAPKIE